MVCMYYFFFFQAEDGIRDIGVTGVQTCALPISGSPRRRVRFSSFGSSYRRATTSASTRDDGAISRSRDSRTAAADRDRKSVVEGKRGDLGGRRIIKKKKIKQSISDDAQCTHSIS